MKLLVISSAPLIYDHNHVKAYAPYVEELILWNKYIDKIQFCCPIWNDDYGLLTTKIPFKIDLVFALRDFNTKSFKNTIKSIVAIIVNISILIKLMKQSDHIHLRCPGNIGLLGCFVQILFPFKPKTAKYAGNWDPKSKQPWSYHLQKWILSNTFLTKNMQVLVYGDWPNQSKNIKPFFTATYSEDEMQIASSLTPRNDVLKGHSEQSEAICLNNGHKTSFIENYNDGLLKFLYVGTLTKNKRPLLCVEIIHLLKQQGYQVQLSLYGDGSERPLLEQYIFDNHLQREVILEGNVSKEMLKIAYQKSHFLLFFSKSEGWPKAVAEALFWGCVPITTSVSCVSDMLGNGTRGTLVKADKNEIIKAIKNYLNHPELYKIHAQNGMDWSRQYTLERFEKEIEKLLI